MVPPILFAHRARLHQRQTQCTKNRTSATSSRRNSTGRGAPSPGSPDSSASRAKTPTRSSTAAGSTPTCSSKSATCWTTISSSVIQITGTTGKKNDSSLAHSYGMYLNNLLLIYSAFMAIYLPLSLDSNFTAKAVESKYGVNYRVNLVFMEDWSSCTARMITFAAQ